MKFARPVFLGIGLVLAQGLAYAEASPPQRSVEFDVPPQSLSSALNAFAKQSDLRVVFYTDVTDGMRSAPVHGNLTPENALKILLAGADLTYEFGDDNSVQIWSPKELAARRGDGELRLTQSAGRAPSSSTSSSSPVSPTSPAPGTPSESSTVPDVQMTRGMPEVLVKGSRSLNTDIEHSRDDARPYLIFQREDLVRSGAQTLDDFFRKSVTVAATTSDATQQASILGNASSIDLGGLGTDETLILVDGRRLAGLSARGSVFQPGINGIPLAAVERIEVLRSTASGIYGGGATGGVVNIILRRDYAGTETALTYEDTIDGGGTRGRVDLSGGYTLPSGNTNLLFSATYSDTSPLLVGDRDLQARGRSRILANSPSTFFQSANSIPLGATTNISSSNGTPLTLKTAYGGGSIGSARTFIPSGYDGPGSDNGAALIANAGTYNFDLASADQAAGRDFSMAQGTTLKSFMGTVRHQFSTNLTGFFEGSYSDSNNTFRQSVAPFFFSLAANAAGNPFNQAVTISVPIANAANDLRSSVTSSRLATGLSYKMPYNWVAAVDYTWNQVELTSGADRYFFNSAATSAMSSGAVNVFRDVNEFPLDLSPYIVDDVVPDYEVDTNLQAYALRASGPIALTFQGGPTMLTAALEHRSEHNTDSVFATAGATPQALTRQLFPEQTQAVDSAYAEVLVPIAGQNANTPLIETLEVQAGVRYDSYRTRGAPRAVLDANLQPTTPIQYFTNRVHSLDPTVSLRYKPIKSVMLRGSFGTGFLPPTAAQLSPTTAATISPATLAARRILDPLRNEIVGASGAVTAVGGGRPDLNPEESKSWSAGVVLTPTPLTGLRLSVDWTRINKSDAIATLNLATPGLIAVLMEGAPDRITRESVASGVGRITSLDLSALNFSKGETEAIDYSVDYSHDTTQVGSFTFSANATQFIHSRTQLTPASDVVENAGVLNSLFGNLKWKGNAGVRWQYRAWQAAWTLRYYGSYFMNPEHSVVAAQASASVGSQRFHDVFVRYSFDGASHGTREGSVLSGVALQLSINNILNEDPAFDAQSPNQNYYSLAGDPRKATYAFTVSKTW